MPKVLNKYKAGVPHGAVYCGPNKKAVSLQVKFSKDFLPTLNAEPTVIAGLQASTAPAPSTHLGAPLDKQFLSARLLARKPQVILVTLVRIPRVYARTLRIQGKCH